MSVLQRRGRGINERIVIDRPPLRVSLRRFGTAEIGHSKHLAVDLGRLHLDFERAVGVYGFRDTVSYAMRGYVDRAEA